MDLETDQVYFTLKITTKSLLYSILSSYSARSMSNDGTFSAMLMLSIQNQVLGSGSTVRNVRQNIVAHQDCSHPVEC